MYIVCGFHPLPSKHSVTLSAIDRDYVYVVADDVEKEQKFYIKVDFQPTSFEQIIFLHDNFLNKTQIDARY